jgi:glucan biosynthesis protein C
MSKPTTPTTSAPRLYFLDWLRVLAMFAIFFFHNSRFYDSFSDWHVKNATNNLGATIFVGFASQWIMPLFFLIAGAGTCLAMRSRNAGQYALERTMRLLVPLIFGMLVIVVPQAYFQAIFHGEQLSQYNFLQIYGLYFTNLLKSLPWPEWFHLWFLKDLFIFSIIALPLFISWKKGGKSVVAKLAGVFDRPWALFLVLIVPIALIDIFVYPSGFWGDRMSSGGWNIITYIWFFVSGYLLFANDRIIETIKKTTWLLLGTGFVISMGVTAFFLDQLANPVTHYGSASFAAAQILQAIAAWGFLLAFLGLTARFLNFSNRFLSYANEAVLPFYILHQTVIISIGFYIVQWSTGVGLKYLVISTTSFAAIMLVYELLVRRINVLRFLFGMRLKRKSVMRLAIKSQTQT